MMESEADVKKGVRKLLDSYGASVWYFMPVPTGYGVRGVPDFIVCFRGRFLAIEAKRPDVSTELKGLQRDHQVAILAAHGLHVVVHNETDIAGLKPVLDHLMRYTP